MSNSCLRNLTRESKNSIIVLLHRSFIEANFAADEKFFLTFLLKLIKQHEKN
jgi:hypothetical protein